MRASIIQLIVACMLISYVLAFHSQPNIIHLRKKAVLKRVISSKFSVDINTRVFLTEIEKANIESEGSIDLLYDSDCPICAMEVEFLKKRDINHRIRFTDLSSPDYNPADHGNVQFEQGMRKIRAVLPDKRVVTGVEVFRLTYDAIGLGWIFELTKLPLIGQAADALYDIWAENRLRITGRGDLADVLKERAEKLRDTEAPSCDEDACDLGLD